MREISAADDHQPDNHPPSNAESATTPTAQPTVAKKSTATTARSRRSKKAVRTVPTSDQGRAACSEHTELFELVEDGGSSVTYEDRLDAAAVCDGCPLSSSCGFRVWPSGNRPKEGQ
ncbi:hypothetical protein [Streptomyces millisiae]|uniref:4Fe-4S Wbl-type domain-containing protein n=1 Tax=Streptomyces millisiae TaxID=3075542 RepID=A0ABU2LP59_9ACTN|nr:hypothetical protein [Streptomyces sp. DSM 44918]MDT0319280.1 hypothetical protein [Streptomyces sp. DSM 44918]